MSTQKAHSHTISYNDTVVFVCVTIIFPGVSLQNEFIRHYTFLGREKHQLQRFAVRISWKQTNWQTKMVQEAEVESRKYGNVGCIVQKSDTLCEKILNMLMKNNNFTPLSPNLKVCQWKWQVTLNNFCLIEGHAV